MFNNIYKNKKVLITGHTGFKGSWLSAWLIKLGANVVGYSVDIPTKPSHFKELNIDSKIKHYIGDVCDFSNLFNVCKTEKPEFIFHLAAQPLVIKSFEDPLATFNTNVIGTLNIAEIVRKLSNVIKVCIFITSDKAYRNVEWEFGYREDDILGGEDPYSGSKGAAELVIYSYMESFFKNTNYPNIASVRAGNVIGGGDWAENRIIPDIVKSWVSNKTVKIRNPLSTRPWQHVLEPLSGYLLLGSNLYSNNLIHNTSFNFGPDSTVNKNVGELIEKFIKYWPHKSLWENISKNKSNHESNLLKLCCDRANILLNWFPTLSFDETIRFTASWYEDFYFNEKETFNITMDQIDEYCKIAESNNLCWVK